MAARTASGQDGQGASTPFRGADRRARPVDPEGFRQQAMAAVFLIGVTALAFAAPAGGRQGALAVEAALAAAAITLAALAGGASLMDWQLAGSARALRVGVALPLLAAGEPGLRRLLPLIDPSLAATHGVRAAGDAMVLVAIGLFASVLVRPEVDTRLRPARMAGTALVLVVGLTILLARIPGAWLPAIDAIALVAVGTGYWIRGVRRRRQLLTWLTLTLFGYALATIAFSDATSAHDLKGELALLLVVLATACALIGSANELAFAYAAQRRSRFDAELNAELAHARFRAERAEREEQLHDTRSAILAIQGATRVLEHQVDSLEPADRASLTAAIDAELERVRAIISVDPADASAEPFSLRSALLPLLTCQRARDRVVVADLPSGLTAVARPAAVVEILQNLIDNAARYAPGSPISVRAEAGNDCIRLRVEDHGPGVPVRARREIFERGVSTGGEPGGGLGLFVSQRLARENGGDLWVEDRPGGGASFVLALPASGAEPAPDRSAPGASAPGAEHFERPPDAGDVGDMQLHDLIATPAPPAGPGVGRQPELERGARART
ncbi:MAG: sensor histidine kinase [Acidimicrobiia bacterium]